MNRKTNYLLLGVIYFSCSFVVYYLSHLFNTYWILNIGILAVTGLAIFYITKNRKKFIGENVPYTNKIKEIPIIDGDKKW